MLGDNLFYGRGFSKLLLNAAEKSVGASIFGYEVKVPQNFGVVEFDTKMHVKSVEEKPVTRPVIPAPNIMIFFFILFFLFFIMQCFGRLFKVQYSKTLLR